MKRRLDYIIADPEGNTTILVLSPVDRADYQSVAKELLDLNPEAEQVGYILAPNPEDPDPHPAMEMCGLEFCGNATRAFALYESLLRDPPLKELDLHVSGCDHPLHGWVEPEIPEDGSRPSGGRVRVEMPLPEEIENADIPVSSDIHGIVTQLTGGSLQGQLVHMDGISHLVIHHVSNAGFECAGKAAMEDLFRYIRDYIYSVSDRSLPAFGVMFVDEESDIMNPVVYVRDVDTIYFEGSCASGSAAAASAQAMLDMDARAKAGQAGGDPQSSSPMAYRFRQPAGTLCIDVTGEDGRITGLQLYGGVTLTEVRSAEAEVTR